MTRCVLLSGIDRNVAGPGWCWASGSRAGERRDPQGQTCKTQAEEPEGVQGAGIRERRAW